ncbi:MAG: MFS transporter [Firmicutes bacterium]|jgi:MFS family permease|nr:MFS transporter [Bacillota bacterium]HPU00859.1 MFS transporter [Bacillota bacterium]
MTGILERYRHLPASVYILTLAALINASGSFVRTFLTMILTDKLGFPPNEAGFIVMVALFLHLPGYLAGGKMADSAGRKTAFLLFSGLAAAAYAAAAFFYGSEKGIWLILAAIFFTSAATPANTAMYMDLTGPGKREAAFSLHYVGYNLGFSLGLLAAGFLYQHYVLLLFWGSALAMLISMILIAFLVRETLPSAPGNAAAPPQEEAAGNSTAALFFKNPLLLGCAFAGILYSIVYSQSSFSLPLLLKELFPLQGAVYYGYLMSTNGITVILLTPLVSTATSRFKSIFNLGLAGIFFACGFGLLYFCRSLPLFFISTIIWTTGEILNAVNLNVFIAEHAPASHRGRFHALFRSMSGAGHSIGPWLFGLFLMHFAIAWVWPISFLLAFLGAAILYALLPLAGSARSPEKTHL